MSRRLVLVAFSMLPITLAERQALLACSCVVILWIQVHCQPFKSNEINFCEAAMLFFLTLISVLSMLKEQVLYSAAHFTL